MSDVAYFPTTTAQDPHTVAMWLCARHMKYIPTDRGTSMRHGLSQRGWERGVDLLRRVGVLDERGRWLVHDGAVLRRILMEAAG